MCSIHFKKCSSVLLLFFCLFIPVTKDCSVCLLGLLYFNHLILKEAVVTCLGNLMTIFSMISVAELVQLKISVIKSIILAHSLLNRFVARAHD